MPADYPGDDAGQKALAKWLAKQAEKAGLPPELPVMAALVESGVKNLNFGDADSVGFFQMRVGIWNQGEYAGYPENPGLQAKWFIDHALAHKKQQIAAGMPTSARTRATGASGSPTWSARPSSSAAATSCGSPRRAACWAEDQSSPPPTLIGSLLPPVSGGGAGVVGPGSLGAGCVGAGSVLAGGVDWEEALGAVVLDDESGVVSFFFLGFGTWSAGNAAAAATSADTVALPTSITSAGLAGAACACDSSPPPAPEMAKAAANAATAAMATMTSWLGFMLGLPSRALWTLSTWCWSEPSHP